MLCEKCHKKEATVHIKEMIGDQDKALHLCADCAGTAELSDENTALNLAEILYKLAAEASESLGLDSAPSAPAGAGVEAPTDREVTCAGCGLALTEFRKTGRLGCAACYGAFAPTLREMLGTMHRGAVHCGRRPGSDVSPRVEPEPRKESVARLQEELSRAVTVEAYERAAELRDEILRAMSN